MHLGFIPVPRYIESKCMPFILTNSCNYYKNHTGYCQIFLSQKQSILCLCLVLSQSHQLCHTRQWCSTCWAERVHPKRVRWPGLTEWIHCKTMTDISPSSPSNISAIPRLIFFSMNHKKGTIMYLTCNACNGFLKRVYVSAFYPMKLDFGNSGPVVAFDMH